MSTAATTTTELTVDLEGMAHQYPIRIGSNLLPTLGAQLSEVLPNAKRVLLVTDDHVGRQYQEPVIASLTAAGLAVHPVVLPAGEASKTLTLLKQLLTEAQRAQLKRSDAVVALGGGVVGDIAGVCAASYYRGTGFVQVPTSLLAQVDSSVGGKVAVNLGSIKNCVGSFYQPHLVLSDIDTLTTLPPREMLAGLAELFKYALIEITACDVPPEPSASLWHRFNQLGADWQQDLPQLIYRVCAIKAQVVRRDATESKGSLDATGRVCLNLGHTFGHAYEGALTYGSLLHGEGVAIGLIHALDVSVRLGLVAVSTATQVGQLMRILSLPTVSPVPVAIDELIAHMLQDKKVIGDRIRLILPIEPLGTVIVRDDVPTDLLREVLASPPAWLPV